MLHRLQRGLASDDERDHGVGKHHHVPQRYQGQPLDSGRLARRSCLGHGISLPFPSG
jgi:hypothetical protein